MKALLKSMNDAGIVNREDYQRQKLVENRINAQRRKVIEYTERLRMEADKLKRKNCYTDLHYEIQKLENMLEEAK